MVDDYAIDLVRRDFNINVHGIAKLKPMGKLSEKERHAEINRRMIEGFGVHSRDGDTLSFSLSGKNIYMKLIAEFESGKQHIKLGFPRSATMKPYYPAIRQWFAKNDIDWSDKTQMGQKYMLANIPNNPDILGSWVEDARQSIFKIDQFSTRIGNQYGTHAVKASTMIMYPITNHLKTYSMLLGVMVVSLIVILIYELFHIFSLSTPSFKNVDFIEIALFLGAFGVPSQIHHLERKPRTRAPSKWSARKKLFFRWTVYCVVLLIMSVTA